MRARTFIRRTAQRLSGRNYYSAKAYHRVTLYLSSFGRKEQLLVFQMGKVGSTSVAKSLKASRLDMPIYHIHFLSRQYIDSNERQARQSYSPKRAAQWTHLWESEFLRKQLDRGLRGKRWKVVTLTREPVGRNLSAFFGNTQVEFLPSSQQYHIQSDYGFETTVGSDDTEQLTKLFLETLDHDTPLVYFDRELRGVLGIDVFSREFPRSRGYQVYEGELADLLVIRLESLNECAHDAFSEFLGIEQFTLTDRNVGSDKAYGPLYRRLRDTIVLPESYVETMYNSKYTRHFYSEEEIAAFRAKWATRT